MLSLGAVLGRERAIVNRPHRLLEARPTTVRATLRSWSGTGVGELDRRRDLTATLEVRLPRPVPVAGPAISLTGPDAGGGVLVWIGGKLHHIKPRSPVLALLEQVVALESATTQGVPPRCSSSSSSIC
jgi:hypothetical protein